MMASMFLKICVFVIIAQISASSREPVNVVTVRGEDGQNVQNLHDIDVIDCSLLGPWNITLNVTVLKLSENQHLITYLQVTKLLEGSHLYVFFDSSVAQSRVVDAALEEGRDPFDPHSILVLKEIKKGASFISLCAKGRMLLEIHLGCVKIVADQNQPLLWCCHVAGNSSSVSVEDQSEDNVQVDFYSYINVDRQETSQLHDSPCPPNTALVANELDEWRQAKERQAKMIVEITTSLKWDTFLILYSAQFEHQVRILNQVASETNVKVIMVNLERTKTAQSIMLRYFETSPDLNVVLITSLQKAHGVFQMALNLEPKIGKRISVTGLSRWLFFCHEGIIHPETWLFSSEFDNIAFISDPRNLGLGRKMEPDKLFLLTTLLYKTGRRELASVGSVYHDWTVDLQQDVFPNVKFGFNGRHFLVTTLSWSPYVYRHEGEDGTVTFSGFCMDMADELSRTLNFTIEYTEPADGYWGVDIGNGTFNGLVGQVASQEVDMVIAPIGITEAREVVIDFTSPFFYDDSAVILKKPDPNASKWRTYIDIFRQEVLWCVFAALLAGFASISLLVRAEMFVYKSRQKVFANSYFGSFLYLYGAMLAQGGRNLPKSAAGRVFLSSWWLFCIVVAGTYSGNLIAVLTVTKDKAPFNTLKEMAAQDEYKFGTLGNSMWTELFKTSPRPEFQAIAKKMDNYFRDDPDIYHSSSTLHLEKVKRGGYAYIADKGLFSSWLATNCDLILLKEKFFPGRYGIVLPNNSVYTKVFSDQVVKFYESGLLQVWVKKWWPQQTFCRGSLLTQARALSLVDMQSSFYVLAIGAAMSLVVLILEAAYSLLAQLTQHSRWMGGGTQADGAAEKAGHEEKSQDKKTVKYGLRLRRF